MQVFQVMCFYWTFAIFAYIKRQSLAKAVTEAAASVATVRAVVVLSFQHCAEQYNFLLTIFNSPSWKWVCIQDWVNTQCYFNVQFCSMCVFVCDEDICKIGQGTTDH